MCQEEALQGRVVEGGGFGGCPRMDQATRRDGQAVRVTNPSLQLVAYYRFAKISLHSWSCATSISTLRIRVAHATWPSTRCDGAPACTCTYVCHVYTYMSELHGKREARRRCVRRVSRGGKRALLLSLSLSGVCVVPGGDGTFRQMV